jgi:phage terminase large subunit-like protein
MLSTSYWQRLRVPPRLATEPSGAPTFGPAVDAVGQALFGRPMQAWQRAVNEVAGEFDPDTGAMIHGVVVLHVPRRAGKSAIALAQMARRVLGQPASQNWYTAQSGGDAGRTFRREWLPILRTSGLARHLKLSMRAGAESFELPARASSATCFPPIETALHGTNVDLAIVDEAWAHDDDAGRGIELAVFPAQLTRPSAQTWIVSAGGTLASTWFDGWLERAETSLAAGRPGVALFEWGADATAPDYDPRDPRTWWTAHPALGDTIREAALAADLERASDVAAFERSVLNVWPRPRQLGLSLDLDAWADLADLETGATPVALGFDISADRGNAALVSAGRAADGRTVIEVLGYRRGSAWLEDEIRQWRRAHPMGVVVADSQAAGTLAERLETVGVEVLRTGGAQMARACADLVDQVTAGTVAHRAQAVLDTVIASAGRRIVSDGWAWSRRNSEGDISPLVAVTLAAWAARIHPLPAAPFVAVAR